MFTKNKPKYYVGQKILVRSPITTYNFTKGETYVGTVVATPEENDVKGVAFSLDEIPSISYALLIECSLIQGLNWRVVNEGENYFHKLLRKITNFLLRNTNV